MLVSPNHQYHNPDSIVLLDNESQSYACAECAGEICPDCNQGCLISEKDQISDYKYQLFNVCPKCGYTESSYPFTG